MLKKSVDEFNSFFKEIDKGWAIVTAGDKFVGYNAMTVSWGGIGILWNKPVAFIFVRKSRYTLEFMNKSDSVTLSFLGDKYLKEKTFFGRNSGRDVNKFEATGLHASFEPDFNGYFVAEAEKVLKLKKLYSTDIDFKNMPESIKKSSYPTDDMHVMYVCEIKQYLVNEE